MNTSLIWCQDMYGVIGNGTTMGWNFQADLQRFKSITTGQTVVMGRKTWESLPAKNRPLPGRKNIVLTRNPDYTAEGATVIHTLDDMYTHVDTEHVYIIGGAEVLQQAIDKGLSDTAWVTAFDEALRTDTPVYAPLLGADWVLAPMGEIDLGIQTISINDFDGVTKRVPIRAVSRRFVRRLSETQ